MILHVAQLLRVLGVSWTHGEDVQHKLEHGRTTMAATEATAAQCGCYSDAKMFKSTAGQV